MAVISIGASCGALLLRWWFGTQPILYLPAIPLGTLTANLVGGHIIGAAVAFFAAYLSLALEAAKQHHEQET
jgi:CrcB protein